MTCSIFSPSSFDGAFVVHSRKSSLSGERNQRYEEEGTQDEIKSQTNKKHTHTLDSKHTEKKEKKMTPGRIHFNPESIGLLRIKCKVQLDGRCHPPSPTHTPVINTLRVLHIKIGELFRI